MSAEPTLVGEHVAPPTVGDDDVLRLDADLVGRDATRQLVRSVPHAELDGDGQLALPLSATHFSAAAVAAVLLPHPAADQLDAATRRRLSAALFAHAQAINRSAATDLDPGRADELRSRLPARMAERLRTDQLAAVDHLLAAGGRGFLADDPGAGKTVCSYALLWLSDAFPAVIACKNRIRGEWEDEHATWLGDTGQTVYTVEGQTPLDEGLPLADVYIVNYELLHHRIDELLAVNPKAVVVDECQQVKSLPVFDGQAWRWLRATPEKRQQLKTPKGSWRTWAVRTLARHHTVDTVLLVSATPSPNAQHREWIPQLDILGWLDGFGGRDRFEERYCRHCTRCADQQQRAGAPPETCNHRPPAKRYGRTNRDGAINAKELRERLRGGPLLRRSQRQLNPKLDPIRWIEVTLPLSAAGRERYERVEHDFLEYLKDGARRRAADEGLSERQAIARAVAAANSDHQALVKRTHLRQAAFDAKADATIDWLADLTAADFDTGLPRKAVAFAYHREAQRRLLEQWPDAARILAAEDMSSGELRANKERFQTDPHTPLLVASLAAAAEGITLDAADYVVFVELPDTPAQLRQAIGRAHGRASRPDHAVTAYALLGVPFDVERAAALDGKRAVMEQLDDGAVDEWQLHGRVGVAAGETAEQAALARLLQP